MNIFWKNSLLIILFVIQFSARSQENTDSIFSDFKVQSIERIKNGFVIDVSDVKDSAWYTIASGRGKHYKYPELEVGKVYKLKLSPRSSIIEFPNLCVIYLVEIKGKTLSIKSRSWTVEIFRTNNIIGKYYKAP